MKIKMYPQVSHPMNSSNYLWFKGIYMKKSPILRFQWILAIFERRNRSIFIAPGNAGGSNAYHTLERRRCSILIPLYGLHVDKVFRV